MLDFSQFEALTFDCYGTLIDWETGIFGAMKPILAAHEVEVSPDEILALYSELEADAESGEYQSYRKVLESVVRGFGMRLRFTPTKAEIESLPESVPTWDPFPDTVAGLQQLQSRFRLAIMSNIDDDIFSATNRKLKVVFDQVVTAQQARCYKPCLKIFQMGLERLGLPASKILHVGQSIYHDIVPAESLGLSTVWVNRPSPRANAGAAKAASGKPSLEVSDVATLARMATNQAA